VVAAQLLQQLLGADTQQVPFAQFSPAYRQVANLEHKLEGFELQVIAEAYGRQFETQLLGQVAAHAGGAGQQRRFILGQRNQTTPQLKQDSVDFQQSANVIGFARHRHRRRARQSQPQVASHFIAGLEKDILVEVADQLFVHREMGGDDLPQLLQSLLQLSAQLARPVRRRFAQALG